MIHRQALVARLQRAKQSRKSNLNKRKNESGEAPARANRKGNQENKRRRNRTSQTINTQSQNTTITINRKNLDRRKRTITTIGINRPGVKTTRGHTKTNIGMIRTRIGLGSGRSVRVRRVTNRDRGGVGRRGSVPARARGGGSGASGGRTIGTAPSATAPTRGPATTTSMIGMSGLGTTGGARAAAATHVTAGEHQVINATGCIFSSFLICPPMLSLFSS